MKQEEKEELREYLSDNYPFALRRESNIFASLRFLNSLDWINSVPDSVLQSFLVFFLLKQVENPQRERECLLDESVPLCTRITMFCKGLLPKSQEQIAVPAPRATTPVKEDVKMEHADTPVVKKKLKFTLPSYVAPPTPAGRVPFMPSLAPYTDSKYANSSQVWFSNTEFSVVYDAYPKAQFHFLILPKTTRQPQDLRALLSCDLDIVHGMHALAKDCVKLICEEHGKQIDFKFGFHANPSLTPLHMHCISLDFNSARMNSTKHWNSFTHPDLWIDIGRVERELEENGAVRFLRSKQELSELETTNEPTCPNCKYRAKLGGVELLKRHLKTKSCFI